MKKQFSKIPLIFLAGLGLGICIIKCFYYPNSTDGVDEIEVPSRIIINDIRKIDSLEQEIQSLKKKGDNQEEKIKVITKWKEIKTSEVKSLPLDSAIEYLADKLRKYEK